MKIQMKSIEVITLSDPKGKLKPLRFRIDGEVVKVRHVNHVLEEQCGKNRWFIYQCQSEIRGCLRTYELKYDLQTCKWVLFKM